MKSKRRNKTDKQYHRDNRGSNQQVELDVGTEVMAQQPPSSAQATYNKQHEILKCVVNNKSELFLVSFLFFLFTA